MSEKQGSPGRDPGRAQDDGDFSRDWLDCAGDLDFADEDAEMAACWAEWVPGDAPGDPARFPAGLTGEDEAFAAGSLPQDWYDGGSRGAGFACGAALDAMEAGPVLALLTASATSPGAGGHAALGESELIGALCAWRRIVSWAAAGQAAAITTLARRRAAQGREGQNRHQSEHVAEEVAAALTLTGRAAEGLLADAAGLARLPEVHEHLASGWIDAPKSAVITGELDVLASDHDAQAIASRVLPDAPALTTGQLRNLLRRLILEADPAAADKRKTDAARDSEVCLWTETSGNAGLAGRELAEADALAADRRLTALACWLSDRGAAGSLGHLRAAVFMALLHGRPVQTLLPEGTLATAGSDDPAGAVAPVVSGTIHLTMPMSAWAGISDAAGAVAGYGPVAASTCRDLAATLADSAATRWCLTLINGTGQAVAHACAPRGHGPPSGPIAWRWAEGLARQMAYLETAECRHTRAENHYRPSRSPQHLIRVRQPRCSFPSCRRPAFRADLDHTIPFEQGGMTCECNLAPLCRRHHQAKQAPGWHLSQDQPGRMTWQLPHGRSYRPADELYPV